MNQLTLRTEPVSAQGVRLGKLPFAFAARFFLLLSIGIIFALLMFVSRTFGFVLLGWNLFTLALWLFDWTRLPAASALSATRSISGIAAQLDWLDVNLEFSYHSGHSLRLMVDDDTPEDSESEIPSNMAELRAGEASTHYRVRPLDRGDMRFGKLSARLESPLRIAQKWIAFDLAQSVRVYPRIKDTGEQQTLLMRSRQIEQQLRTARQRGFGREFESLREFQQGDELRDICWTATARRGKAVTTLRQSERSQMVWAVLDCGRLMRSRVDARSKLDYGAETAIRLIQLASFSGDSAGLLAYGTQVQRRVLPGRGDRHLRLALDQLALVRAEAAEADHLRGAAALQSVQKRRALIMWITDLADLFMTPDVVTAVLQASKRHLVVMAIMGQPDLRRIVSQSPASKSDAFRYAAATETLSRREIIISTLRNRGVHVIDVDAPELTGTLLNKYLEIKARNLL